MIKKYLIFAGAVAVIFITIGAGCGLPGEQNVVNGDYLNHPKTAAVATTTTSSTP